MINVSYPYQLMAVRMDRQALEAEKARYRKYAHEQMTGQGYPHCIYGSIHRNPDGTTRIVFLDCLLCDEETFEKKARLDGINGVQILAVHNHR